MTSDRNVLTNPACYGGILTNPGWSRNNSEQAHPLTKVFWPIPLASVVILSIPTHYWRNSDLSLPPPKEFWPIPPTTKGILSSLSHHKLILSHPTCCQRNSNQSHQRPATEGNLNFDALCWRNTDKSCLLPNTFGAILPAPYGIMSNPARFWRNSEPSCTLSTECWLVLPAMKEFSPLVSVPPVFTKS